MAYVSKQWKDRLVEYPNRRTITHDDLTQEVVSVNRNEGTIYEAGDVLDSVNMNNLESRIAAGLNEKQNTLTAGSGITIVNDVISATGGGGGGAVIDDTTTALDKTWSSSKIDSELDDKQDTLTAGTGISIVNNVISATGGGGASALDDLTDVDITTPSNGDVLKYNATAQKWENGTGGGGSQSFARNLIIAGDDLRTPVAPLGSSSSHFSPNYGFLIDNNTTNSITFYFGGGGIDTTKTYTLRMQIFINGTVYFKKLENISQAPQYGVTFELGGVTFTIMVLSLYSTSIVMTNISSSTSGNFLQAVSLIEDNASELPFNGADSEIVTELRRKLTYKDLTDTLTAGNTSITISDSSITTNSTIDIYTDVFGVNPTSVSVSTGSVTLTFAALQADLGVKVRVS